MSIQIGHIKTRNKVFLAPMSGVTDLPFRQMANTHGAGLVISEMIASKELARTRSDMIKKTRHDTSHETSKGGSSPFFIQLAGREAKWMAEGARVAQGLGCDAIDINMGCPARQVTGSLSGSALMRNLDHALELIEATVEAASVPVTVKMRLGWDEKTINAPELARRAESAGVAMLTVHGRTRCQFYKGKADWAAIAAVKKEVSVPVIANGDGQSVQDINQMLEKSGADGVMIGRGAYGRPWVIGQMARQLELGEKAPVVEIERQVELAIEHYQLMISFYGAEQGMKNARKHLGWLIQRLGEQRVLDDITMTEWRSLLMKETDPSGVVNLLKHLACYSKDNSERAA